MYDHPGLSSCVIHGMPISIAQHLAQSYGPVNAASPTIMAGGLTKIRERELFYVLLKNLWEECGEGEPSRSHIEMFECFSRAVEVEPSYILTPGSFGARLVDDFVQVCKNEPEHRVLAMFHGFEAVFPYICGQIDLAIRRGNTVPTEAARFFPFHAVHDLEHAATTRGAMLRSIKEPGQEQECLDFAIRSARLIYDLFDEVFTS